MADLPMYAEQFSYPRDPTYAIAAGQAAAQAGHYTREGVLAVVNWKSARTKGRLPEGEEDIKAATTAALSAGTEEARMEALTALPGVGVPVASALLLYALGETYPILDVKALSSLDHSGRGVYPTEFWLRYLEFVRELAASQDNMSARAVEKALWEYAKQQEHG